MKQESFESQERLREVKADYSRFVRRIRRRYPAELSLLPGGVPDAQVIEKLIRELNHTGYDLGAALRVARQVVIERLAVLDIEKGADLEVVTQVMTILAEKTLEIALTQSLHDLDEKYGIPTCKDGSRCAFWIMGMGKLGGAELNVSSDIDLIYLYEEAGQTIKISESGEKKYGCSNHDYFDRVAKRLHTLIGEVTEHGFVFRMDLALRPSGRAGPLAISLPMLREYFAAEGRDWERFAWMKARVITTAGDLSQVKEERVKLKQTIRSFVYRGYLDFTVLNSLRQTHLKIRQQEADKEVLRSRRCVDVKLSRGGIRELEFAVQLFQVVRGGRFPEIRTASTLFGLQRLAEAGLISSHTAQELHDAYVFLRKVEHRIQYLDDQQTHLMPLEQGDLHWIACSMHFCDELLRTATDVTACLSVLLQQKRDLIAAQFDELLFFGGTEDNNNLQRTQYFWGNESVPGEEAFVKQLPESLRERASLWGQSTRIQRLQGRVKSNLGELILRSAQWLEQGKVAEVGVLRFIDWLDVILRRESYQALLLERPAIHLRLLRVFGEAHWAVFYLRRYPGVMDELRDDEIFKSRFDRILYEAELQLRRQALQAAGEEDEEMLMNVLRRAHHAEFFRVLIRDIEGHLRVEQVADDLSALADVTLKVALDWSWDYLKQRHAEKSAMGIVAYGKLGGIELGYGSDLDIVFIYDDNDEHSAEIYSAHVRKLITWLTSKTSEGDLFEIDTSLRPNGNSGLLVSSIEAFEAYQLGRGSNTAWTWEHQALTRARCAVGSKELARRFDAVRYQVLTVKRDVVALKQEILAMRQRVREAYPLHEDALDIKHGEGGMLDIEFCVQYLVLAHSWHYPELEEDAGNIALLQRAQAVGLLPAPVGEEAANAYRTLRQIQHHARLNDGEMLDTDIAAQACRTGFELWQCSLGL